MFLEEKKTGEAQVQQPSLTGFIAWLETMPRNGVYNWRSGTQCACAQYAEAIGQIDSWNKFCGSGNVSQSHYQIWQDLNRIAYHASEANDSYQGTFGATLMMAKQKL